MFKKYANTIENLIVALVTLMAINFIIIAPLRKDIAKIASQPKYAINNDFEKMRTKKDGSIVLDLNNELNDNHVTVNDSTATSEVKRGLWKRVFRKNK